MTTIHAIKQNRAPVKSKRVRAGIFLAGIGTVGGAFAEQVNRLESKEFDFRFLGICNSRETAWNKTDVPINGKIQSLFAENRIKTNWNNIVTQLEQSDEKNLIFVDATGSEEVARYYVRILRAGIHIVTPSKLANTFEQEFYNRLHEISAENGTHYRYEATAGAGLPVIESIRRLRETGDIICKISGVVSGTMTYLFSQLEQGRSFGDVIREAAEKGYAEPDPRDDLSGEDVARKLIILARTAGFYVNRTDFGSEDLTPESLKSVTKEEFLAQADIANEYWSNRISAAKERGNVLRYTGTLSGGKIEVGVSEVPASSPLGTLRGTDNQIQIYTDFYDEYPLIIQGPGAGRDVTAQAVLGDVLDVASRLG